MSSEITRELLQTAAVEGMPGWETRLFLITYPAGVDGSGHSHPVPGLVPIHLNSAHFAQNIFRDMHDRQC